MAQAIPIHVKNFAEAYAFLKRDLPLTAQRPDVWEPFKQFSNLTQQEALDAVSWNSSPPWVFAAPLLSSQWALFMSDMPTRIQLSTVVLDHYEADPQNPKAQRFLLAKVLHELCHWGCFRKNAPDVEVGEAFESQAFGAHLFPWWTPEAPAAIAGAAAADDIFTDLGARAAACRDLLLKHVHVPGKMADPSHTVFGGEDVSEPLPRGFRNNNPGNMRISANAWLGLADMADMTDFQRNEKSFCVFREPEWGMRALAVLLRTYKREHGLVTPMGIISRYAPSGDNNDVASYSAALASALGVGVGSVVNADDDATVIKMIKAIARHENGAKIPYSDMQFSAALLL